jgi:RNA polymerase sigma-70 factor (ECF subfamily)
VSAVEPALDFGKFYREHFRYAWRTLRRLGVRERDLPDLTHDFFVVVFRQLHLYDRSRPMRPWLFGIAYRVVSDYRRSARHAREVLEEPPEVVDQAPSADHHVAASEGWSQVLAVLDRLDLDRRTVFIMHDVDEQPGAEIAAALGIPLATVYSRLRVAREDVAAAMKRIRLKEERARP